MSVVDAEIRTESVRPLAILQGYVDHGEIAGLDGIVHRYGKEVYAEALGWKDKEAQIPMMRDTLFRIMSMTKPVTAVAALMLVEEGRIRLYDPVDNWLPELSNRIVLRDPKGMLDNVFPNCFLFSRTEGLTGHFCE